MRRLFTALLLLLIAGAAFADGSGTLSGIANFRSTLAPPESDYSVAYLGQIFGTVGNVLHGNGSQILGKMFEIFNKGILVVAALWLGYSTFTVVFRAAGEGAWIGQNKSAHFIFLRIALGFGLLVPSPTTGYSVIQDAFMKVVVESVGLADQVWDTALDYMEYGGRLYIPPNTMETDPSIVSNALGSTAPSQPGAGSPLTQSGYGPLVKIFQDEVCMIASAQGFNGKSWVSSTNPESYHPVFSSPATTVDQFGATHFTPGTVYFPGGSDSHQSDTIIKNNAASCGSITAFSNNSSSAIPSSTTNAASLVSISQNMNSDAFSALKQMVLSLIPAAENYVENSNSSTITQGDLNSAQKNHEKTAFSAILAYTNLMTPYQNMAGASQSGGSTIATTRTYGGAAEMQGGFVAGSEFGTVSTQTNLSQQMIDNAEAQGWIMAGAFYWNLEQGNNFVATIDMSALYPTQSTPPTLPQAATITQAGQYIYGFGTALGTLWSQYVGAQQNNVIATGADGSGAASAGPASLAGNMGNSAMSTIVQEVYGLSDPAAYNPIVVLMNLGNGLMNAVVLIWMAAIVLSVVISAGAAICSGESPGATMTNAALTWTKSIIMLITTAMMIPGAILAYYVPLYPFTVFTFAAVGWIVTVIEGMAAAPLICLGVTHPEGHDFLGKADQALMLFLGIFIRPALMVLGMVAAMITSFVAFHILITGLGSLMSSMENSTSSFSGSAFLVLVNMAMVLVIFGFLSMELVEQCFKLIFQLPNYILKWIGGPATGEDYGQMAKGVQGVVSSTAQTSGQAIGKVGEASMSVGAAVGSAIGGSGGCGTSSHVPGTGGTPPTGGSGTPSP